jgi:NADPH-dependent 2,4-dienoyl-CoA reductase/sulfur reductase-like enzyme
MGRRLLADPELPRKLAGASGAAMRPCIYSYRCVGNVVLRAHATCTVNPALSRGPERDAEPTSAPKHVVVAGGGPAGLEVTRRLCLGGHRVTLLERASRLGGLAHAAGAAEPDNAALPRWLEGEVRRLGAALRLGQEATAEGIAALSPDAVVVAIGAGPGPALPGSGLPHVLERGALSGDPAPLLARGPQLALVGGDLVGVSLAAWLAGLGARVTLLEEGEWLATQMPPPRRWRALHALADRQVEVVRGARVDAIEPGRVVYADGEQRERTCRADTVVLARAAANDASLADSLAARGLQVASIGDCTGPRYFEGCLLDAWQTARSL